MPAEKVVAYENGRLALEECRCLRSVTKVAKHKKKKTKYNEKLKCRSGMDRHTTSDCTVQESKILSKIVRHPDFAYMVVAYIHGCLGQLG